MVPVNVLISFVHDNRLLRLRVVPAVDLEMWEQGGWTLVAREP